MKHSARVGCEDPDNTDDKVKPRNNSVGFCCKCENE